MISFLLIQSTKQKYLRALRLQFCSIPGTRAASRSSCNCWRNQKDIPFWILLLHRMGATESRQLLGLDDKQTGASKFNEASTNFYAHASQPDDLNPEGLAPLLASTREFIKLAGARQKENRRREKRYSVEDILRHRTTEDEDGHNVSEVLVKWTGYNVPTWEPISEDIFALTCFIKYASTHDVFDSTTKAIEQREKSIQRKRARSVEDQTPAPPPPPTPCTFKASDRVSLDSYTGTVQASSYFIDDLEYIDIVWDDGTEHIRKIAKVRRTLTSTKNLQLLSVEGTRPPRACRSVAPARRIPGQ